MNLLLVTHALIWFIEGDTKLTPKAIDLIKNIDNTCYISVASLWEISIKISIGKLKMKVPYDNLSELLWKNSIYLLSIKFEHTQKLISLPYYHKDPFDRLIISQAIVEKISIISKDEHFNKYDIKVLW